MVFLGLGRDTKKKILVLLVVFQAFFKQKKTRKGRTRKSLFRGLQKSLRKYPNMIEKIQKSQKFQEGGSGKGVFA